MMEDHRRQAIAQDLQQSELAMKAARLLKDAGLYNDALSRLYSALHHAAREEARGCTALWPREEARDDARFVIAHPLERYGEIIEVNASAEETPALGPGYW
jgi:hypothetical protein